MEALILDKTSFELLVIIDTFTSFIWTERYYQYGDFEIYMKFDPTIQPYLLKGNYIALNNSDKMMIIERVLIESTTEEGTFVTISGRSLESILTRRIVWGETVLTGDFQDGIKLLLDQNIISPTITKRKIPNFDFVPSTDDKIKNRPIDSYFFGDNLYDAVHLSCAYRQIGMKVYLQNGRFKFTMYTGVDRSYNQNDRPWVVFSPDFDNLESSKYETDDTNFANTSLVIGEETFSTEDAEGNVTTYPQILLEVALDDSSGLDRQEVFTDASSTSRTEYTDEGETAILSEETYKEMLRSKGKEELSNYQSIEEVDGHVDTTRQFVYGQDFKIGDIVQVVNDYGFEIPSRITEVIRSQDVNGYKVTPTFVSLKSESEEA